MAKSARGLPWSYPGATLELPWSYPGATLELPCGGDEIGGGEVYEAAATTRPGALDRARRGAQVPLRRRRPPGPRGRVIRPGVLGGYRVTPQKPRGPKTTKYEKNVQNRSWFVWGTHDYFFFPILNLFSENTFGTQNPRSRVLDPIWVAGYMRKQKMQAKQAIAAPEPLLPSTVPYLTALYCVFSLMSIVVSDPPRRYTSNHI